MISGLLIALGILGGTVLNVGFTGSGVYPEAGKLFFAGALAMVVAGVGALVYHFT